VEKAPLDTWCQYHIALYITNARRMELDFKGKNPEYRRIFAVRIVDKITEHD